MTGNENDTKVKARLPHGFIDRGPEDIAATRAMLDKIREMFERYGFSALETPLIEFTDALGKFLPDQDRPNEGVFSFKDDERWLSLRYDLTAPLARHVAENFERLPKPYRSYRVGPVFRNEKPGPGRFRQFMQFDADIVGASSPAADAEMAMLMADTLEAVGIKRGEYVIKIHHRKVLDGIIEAHDDLAGEKNAARRLIVLRALDKYDRLGETGVRALLGRGRKDQSGDVTKGAGLNNETIDSLIHYLRISDIYKNIQKSDETVANLTSQLAQVRPSSTGKRLHEDIRAKIIPEVLYESLKDNSLGLSAVDELQIIWNIIQNREFDDGRIVIDTSVVRGLEYYTGPIFEAELTFDIPGPDGKPMRFGSVAGGGRYDGLVARFRGEPVPATGFSIGVSRLLAALHARGTMTAPAAPAPVVIAAMDREHMAEYFAMAGELREAGIAAEVYLGEGGLNAQLKYADRRGAPCVVIQGSKEREAGLVQIKDLILGATLSGAPDRETYLRLQSEARREVARDSLVPAIRELMARHAI